MFNPNLFFSISEIQTALTQTPIQNRSIKKVGNIIQYLQTGANNVLNKMLDEKTGNHFLETLVPLSVMFHNTHQQISELFDKIDQEYDQNPSAELLILLKQCSQLRRTLGDMCSLLQQARPQPSSPNQLTDADFQAAAEATQQQYGNHHESA